jgi:hypothetical protein|tara:strand:+ start:162 stop:578 length:417 start_codon:yes stop_codon:yes gene_type:complete
MDLFKDDPVRPNLNPKFRLTENRVNFLLTQDFTKPCAIICVAFTKDIPKTEKQLEMYSINKLSVNYDKAIFYTIWSYSKGSGKDILFNTVFWLKKNKPEIKRYITMSPKTEMARNFHLKNGAYELKSNRETINFEYII